MNSLLQDAMVCVQQKGVVTQEIPLYVFATGGIRSIPSPDRDRLLQSVYSHLRKESPFFTIQNSQFDVLTGSCYVQSSHVGEMESRFGWLAVNHLAHSSSNLTVGSIDLGGASLEIAFLPKGSQDVHTPSFSSLGADPMRLHILNYLQKEDRNENPCYPQGYEEDFNGRRIVGTSDVPSLLGIHA